MRKTICTLIALFCIIGNSYCQTISFTNTSCQAVGLVNIEYVDASCNVFALQNGLIIAPVPGKTYTFNISTICPTCPTGGNFFHVKFGDACAPGVGSPGVTCPYLNGGYLWKSTSCSSRNSTSTCYEVDIATCSACAPGTAVNATWTNLGSGNVQVDFY